MKPTESIIRTDALPPIPNKRYFTIGEASELCQLKPHVLRYWEHEFSQLTPAKRRGNRRYYRAADVQLIRAIRSLLYEQGYTLHGAKAQLLQTKITSGDLSSSVKPSIAQQHKIVKDKTVKDSVDTTNLPKKQTIDKPVDFAKLIQDLEAIAHSLMVE